MPPDQIHTPRLVLRPFSIGDADALWNYSGDAEWGRYQGLVQPYTRAEADRFLAGLLLRDRQMKPTWAMTKGGAVIGIVSLKFEAEHRIAVLGYGVHKQHWGEGLCVEAACAAIGQAFETCHALQRIRAHTDARNSGSIRVLQKLNFKHEGMLRSNGFFGGEFVDEAVFGLLREEWRG
ncbi:GNAT family N-acetyltransferase [Phenylobacterium sp.]|uniref:GNAT family N-acetyltransferase n=1 Tax=Phenylobacterium sp. TaxID=1871053 RepID=UPI0035649AAA